MIQPKTSCRHKLSAIVISYNRQETVGTVLRGVQFADEVILLDKSSTDRTAEIGATLADRVVRLPWSPTVEETRASIESFCAHDWILFLDDDECLSPEAALFIDQELYEPRADLYRLPLRHYIMAQHDEDAYYWPESHIRLFRKGALRFVPTVHGGIQELSERGYEIPPDTGISIHHLSHTDVRQWVEKTNRYTSRQDRVRMLDEGASIAHFAHHSIDRWMGASRNATPGSYPEAVAILRCTYDLIDRLKSWEEARGIDGPSQFATLCQAFDAAYEIHLAAISRPRMATSIVATLALPQADAAAEPADPILVRANASLVAMLRQTQEAGDALRQAHEHLRSEAEHLRVEVERQRAEAERERAEAEHLHAEIERQRAEAERWQTEAEHLQAEVKRQRADYVRLQLFTMDLDAQVKQIHSSTSWRLTGPLRRLGRQAPFLARTGRRALRLAFWAATGQLRRRLEERRQRLTLAAAQLYAGEPAEPPILSAELPAVPTDVARRILVADYRVPRPDVSAGERATVGILRDLRALGFEVTFLPNDMVPSPQYEESLRAAGVEIVTRAAGFEHSVHYLEAHGHLFGAFYLIRVEVAETLLAIARRVAPAARILFHAPDLYFLREMREAELRDDHVARARARQTRDRELAMMSRSDRVVVVSPAEVPVLREALPDTPISVFPVLYAPVVETAKPFAERRDIFFLGGFGHRPNIDAVQWFATDVWPHVHYALPDARFLIIGAEAPDSVTALGRVPGIEVVGFVPELDRRLETLRVGVAPLRYGAGIKGKVAVTLGAGIPCVCTTIAAEGMGLQDGVHARIENDPLRFAEAIVELYRDEATWRRLSDNGRALVRDRYGDAANRACLLKVLDRAQALPLALFQDYCRAAPPVPVPSPAPEADVDVSIIIPVYNKWHLTRACLVSIVTTSVDSGVTYEVILADDGSNDETVHAAEMFPGLRVVRTPTNLGFLRNCNHAASEARGRHLLLLNNDTIVLPGWLEALYRAIESSPSIAIAGSKLLYPDGLIQEAGAVIFRDGTAINIGRGSGRHAEIFSLPRETDYISGASFLIRKSFWDAVGGFDERYKIAYCEDSDLAMTARSIGMQVVYEPASEVIHFEHQTYAEQAPSHNASLQNHNIAILCEKWREVFASQHLPRCDWHLAAANAERTPPAAAKARRATGCLNVLYFSPFPSHPPSHGNRATIVQFGQYFQRLGHKVHFVLLQSSEFTEQDAATMRGAWDSLDILPFSNPMVANDAEILFDSWYEEGLGERIRLLCAKYDIDIVFCSYVFQSKLLEYVPNYMLKVIDTHDKMGDRYEMLLKNGQPLEFFSCTPAEEGAYLSRADLVVARREEEAQYFDSLTGRNSAIVIPHVEEPRFIERNFDSLNNVGIVASANRINLAIVRECLEAIDRRLGEAPCPFVVRIAGQVKDMVDTLPENERALFERPWVQMLGFVPDISRFYAEIDVIVSPVTMGTGINVKTVQAMAFGLPLLSTAWGMKGIKSDEAMHAHPDLDTLAASLIGLKDRPDELGRLAAVSRARYCAFFDQAMRSFVNLCMHPKLQIPCSCSTLHDGNHAATESGVPSMVSLMARGMATPDRPAVSTIDRTLA